MSMRERTHWPRCRRARDAARRALRAAEDRDHLRPLLRGLRCRLRHRPGRRQARGECGMMTTLVNLFNATNKDNIVVKPQIIEWGPYYQQLNARIAAQRHPTIAVMHTSQLGDFIRARIVEPIAMTTCRRLASTCTTSRPCAQERRHCQRQDLRPAVGHPFLALAHQRRPVQEAPGSSTASGQPDHAQTVAR